MNKLLIITELFRGILAPVSPSGHATVSWSRSEQCWREGARREGGRKEGRKEGRKGGRERERERGREGGRREGGRLHVSDRS